MESGEHKAGFVNIIGRPNAGKSTLMNALLGEKLSIITSKAQTTRHRIMGILNGEDFQIVYSDTPGIVTPAYELHQAMMRFVASAIEDADLLLFIADIFEDPDDPALETAIDRLNRSGAPILFLLNKIDLASDQNRVQRKIDAWKNKIKADEYLAISALLGANIDPILPLILERLPTHPAYFPKDELSDKSERFFAAEIIREKIFMNYKKEVPYSVEVAVTEFKEEEAIIRMRAEIFVERQSQKGIIIGKKGEMLKKVGIEARKDLENFFGKQVYLEQFVKVEPDWRKRSSKLNKFGYH